MNERSGNHHRTDTARNWLCGFCGRKLEAGAAYPVLGQKLEEFPEFPEAPENSLIMIRLPILPNGGLVTGFAAASTGIEPAEEVDILFPICSANCGRRLRMILEEFADVHNSGVLQT